MQIKNIEFAYKYIERSFLFTKYKLHKLSSLQLYIIIKIYTHTRSHRLTQALTHTHKLSHTHTHTCDEVNSVTLCNKRVLIIKCAAGIKCCLVVVCTYNRRRDVTVMMMSYMYVLMHTHMSEGCIS